jgi:redox-sensitive bicupin YhaK (pirin superfamily)
LAEYLIHKADTRGHSNLGWLESYHSFSFGGYYDAHRMNFGALRVLNDDQVEAGQGFNSHPHDNMEIISIPLEGELEHKDSMGNVSVIRKGDVQVMSAGTGVSHSEFNKSKDKRVRFLQIWVFPSKRNVQPRYGQIAIDHNLSHNRFLEVVSPGPKENGAWIYQDAWFHVGRLDKDTSVEYSLKKTGNGVYLFLLEGKCSVDTNPLGRRDAIGITGTDKFQVQANEQSEMLLMEVPMKL